MKEEAKAWLDKAMEDWETAKYNLKGKRLDAAIFYSQQAAEKSLKALQIEKLNKFDKVHDLIALAKSINAEEPILRVCDIINPSYFISRYPDMISNYGFEEAKEILSASQEVLKWIKTQLI